MWRSKIETMSRKDLKKLQEEKLKRQVQYVYSNSTLHHKKFDEAGIKPGDIKSLEDMKKLPSITREDMKKAVTIEDIYGGRLCVSKEKLWLIAHPPETMVEPPLILTGMTHYDRQAVVEQLIRHLVMSGMVRGDIVEVQASMWELIVRVLESGWHSQSTVQNQFPFTAIPLECTLSLLDIPRMTYLATLFKPRVIITTADVAKLMAKEVEKEGKTPKEAFNPQIVIHRTRYDSPVLKSKLRKGFKETWGGIHLNMLDIQDNHFFAMECENCNGLHLWEDHFIVETVDSKTGEIDSNGVGNLVITNISEEAISNS
ncbi:MAG: phenylacetate--CoA ligase family protein [Candidatus Jordarchaeum sp.]|uniref:phenylacetate--CoA ligase family protein n=1 Tax=Candidatus Jordarchaeum sp. TaxID=2823881 RepID=UPI00404AE393